MAAVLGALGPVLKPRGQLQQPVGPAAHAAAPGAGARGGSCSRSAPTRRGEIASLAAIAAPTVGVVTVVSRAGTPSSSAPSTACAEEKARWCARSRPTASWCSTPTTRAWLGMRARDAGRACSPSAAPPAPTCARRGRREDDGDGLALHARAAGAASGRCACTSRAGTTWSTRWPRPASGSRSGSPLEQSPRGLEAARPAKGRCVWRARGGAPHPRRHLQRQPGLGAAPRWTRWRAATDARRRGGGARRHAGAGRDRARRRTATWAARSAASGAAEFVGMGRWAADRGGGGARRPGSRRAIT